MCWMSQFTFHFCHKEFKVNCVFYLSCLFPPFSPYVVFVNILGRFLGTKQGEWQTLEEEAGWGGSSPHTHPFQQEMNSHHHIYYGVARKRKDLKDFCLGDTSKISWPFVRRRKALVVSWEEREGGDMRMQMGKLDKSRHLSLHCTPCWESLHRPPPLCCLSCPLTTLKIKGGDSLVGKRLVGRILEMLKV